ncbi:hypothetical protein PAPHI01_2403 [Pancytospora philotis]|nr:hypothetical protein PAPHI01_2403 [Pancytospora philotis]
MQSLYKALGGAPRMNLMHFFACMLMFILVPMLSEGLNIRRNRDSSASQDAYRVQGVYAEEKRLRVVIHQDSVRRQEEKVARLPYHRYHKGQPEVADENREKNPKAIFQKMCEPGFYEEEDGPISSDGSESAQAEEPAEEERAVSRAPAEMSELFFWGSSKVFYDAVGKIDFVISPPLNKAADAADIVRPTFGEADRDAPAAVPESSADIVYSYMYSWMVDMAAVNGADDAPRRVMPMAKYFLNSERFLTFLDNWKPSGADVGLKLTRDEVSMIRALVLRGRSFDSLTQYHKLVFSKLLLVRTGFDAFGMMKAGKYELGFGLDRRATVGNFLHALYEYFMTVYNSDGDMKVLTPIRNLVIKTPLFSSAYAQCDMAGPLHVVKHHGPKKYSVELGLDIVDSAPAYFKSLIIAALAWQESSFTRIEQDVMLRLAGEMRDYNRSE